MLHPFLLFFSVLVIISVTSALPPTPLDWSIDSEPLDNTDQSNLQANAENSDQPKCTADTSTTNVADETIDNNQDLGIFRRNRGFCPPGSGQEVQAAPRIISKPRITNKGDVDPRCTVPNQNLLATCHGPEVWFHNGIRFVLNCVLGEKSIIQARGGWAQYEGNLGLYCCYALDDFSPLWAGIACTKINEANVEEWDYNRFVDWKGVLPIPPDPPRPRI